MMKLLQWQAKVNAASVKVFPKLVLLGLLLSAPIFCFAQAEDSKGLGASFSPDGRAISFYKYVSDDFSQARIYTVNLDGTNLKEVSRNYQEGAHTEPKWSRDGRKIGFTSFLKEGAKIMQVDLETLEVKELATVTEGGYHMFSCWDEKGEGYYFFHWPAADGFHPDAYYFNGKETIRLTSDRISTRPQLSTNGELYISKVLDAKANKFEYHKFDLHTKTSVKIDSIEGFVLSGEHLVKQLIEENTTKFILEDLEGNDLKVLGRVPFKDVMFETIDSKLRYVIFNTGFEKGPAIYLLQIDNGEIRKLNTSS